MAVDETHFKFIWIHLTSHRSLPTLNAEQQRKSWNREDAAVMPDTFGVFEMTSRVECSAFTWNRKKKNGRQPMMVLVRERDIFSNIYMAERHHSHYRNLSINWETGESTWQMATGKRIEIWMSGAVGIGEGYVTAMYSNLDMNTSNWEYRRRRI